MRKKIQRFVAIALYTIIALSASFAFLYQAGSLPKYIFDEDFYMISLWLSFAVVILFVFPVTCAFTYGFSFLYIKTAQRIKSRWLNPCMC